MHAAEGWRAKIEAHIGLWRSLKFSCISIRTGSGWTNLFGRCILSPENPEPSASISPLVETENVLALSGQLPIERLPNLLQNLMQDNIFGNDVGFRVRLSLGEDRKGSWYPARRQDRPFALRDLGVDFSAWVASYNGPGVLEVLAGRFENDIDESLRVTNPPFDGLSGLCRSMGIRRPAISGGNADFDLIAPIPIRFCTVSQNLSKERLYISVELSATADLNRAAVSSIYSTNQESHSLGRLSEWKAASHGNALLRETDIDLHQNKGRLKVVLSYGGTLVELHDHYLSSLDSWARTCEFFDPELNRSKELNDERGKMRVESLEMSALRLLGLIGLRTVWFGKQSTERKPDILACHDYRDGRKALLLVECTEEDPTAKIAKVSHEAESLRHFLRDDASIVIPMIFTSGECSAAESEQAGSQKVAIVGADEVRAIFASFGRGRDLERILNYIEGLSVGNVSQSILHQS